MMFRRHMQDIRQRMDHLNNLVEVKGHKDLRFGGFGRRGGGRDRFFKRKFTIYNL